MTRYQVEKGIPIPRLRQRRDVPEMSLGDSFFVPLDRASSIRSWVYARKKAGEVYTTRKVVSGGVVGIRVWRIE